ncbi:UPF0462 protein C4orf33 homolog isoform X2 [Octopus bimaculoides]|uniref:Uncharacterized protein n=1 Tax=Octopus bimaculoides TaxID=37653 RepID=A0A0L8G049_OCTBM|nr:UPF0462 protein C4orf33 homolog isoform X2 [Octopus bimaculoides]|eukprot:XP_014785367.1 PREDICTED: UPF0462 protein C4orf33 homolog isoform X2 [Octopus bimaculoides]
MSEDSCPHPSGQLNRRDRLEFEIKKQWDGTPLTKADTVKLYIEGVDKWLRLEVEAPFYKDPAPPKGKYGQAYPELYNYEVVEAFFLNDTNQYLEVELAPRGEHLVLMLNGRRNAVVQQLPLYNIAEVKDGFWRGIAYIDNEYLPENVTKFNAFAIHGSKDSRIYSALFPAPKGQFEYPDFHRLEYFQEVSFDHMPPFNRSTERNSKLWSMYTPRQ